MLQCFPRLGNSGVPIAAVTTQEVHKSGEGNPIQESQENLELAESEVWISMNRFKFLASFSLPPKSEKWHIRTSEFRTWRKREIKISVGGKSRDLFEMRRELKFNFQFYLNNRITGNRANDKNNTTLFYIYCCVLC